MACKEQIVGRIIRCWGFQTTNDSGVSTFQGLYLNTFAWPFRQRAGSAAADCIRGVGGQNRIHGREERSDAIVGASHIFALKASCEPKFFRFFFCVFPAWKLSEPAAMQRLWVPGWEGWGGGFPAEYYCTCSTILRVISVSLLWLFVRRRGYLSLCSSPQMFLPLKSATLTFP